jgi:hypothetical protein
VSAAKAAFLRLAEEADPNSPTIPFDQKPFDQWDVPENRAERKKLRIHHPSFI